MSQSQYNQVIANTASRPAPRTTSRSRCTTSASSSPMKPLQPTYTSAPTARPRRPAKVTSARSSCLAPGAWSATTSRRQPPAGALDAPGSTVQNTGYQGSDRRQPEPARVRLPDVRLASVPDWQHARERRAGVRLRCACSPLHRHARTANAGTRVASDGWKSQAFLGRFSAAMLSSNLLAAGTDRPVSGTEVLTQSLAGPIQAERPVGALDRELPGWPGNSGRQWRAPTDHVNRNGGIT